MRFLADENFNGKLFSGVCAALPNNDILRVQDIGKTGIADPELLEWAAEQNCILLTYDVQTMTGYAYDRVRKGLPLPGIIEVRVTLGLCTTIDELVLLIEASSSQDFENQVRYIPLR